MQTRNRLFDDLAKVANSAAGTIAGVKGEIEAVVRQRVESFIGEMNIVTREEFDAVKAMAAKARDEQEKLKKKIAKLEAKLAAKTPAKPKKAAAKKSKK
jgi:BMFP domain-containing protein YqiC